MKGRVSLIIVTMLSCFFCLASCSSRGRYVAVTGYAQGGTYSIKFNLAGVTESRENIKEAVDSILILVDTTLSGYNKASMLSRFNAGEEVVPNQLFCDIYSYCYDIYEETRGCVDVASGPLFDIWGFGFSTDSLPSDDLVKETIAACGIVSSEVAAAMAEGVRRVTGSTYSVATTGWADSYGDEREPAGTVWVAVSGPSETRTARFNFRHDRKRNIERFAASALNELRKLIESDLQVRA